MNKVKASFVFSVLATLSFGLASAQMFVNANTDIYINPGVTVVIKGDFENRTNGTVSNDGIIEVTGNWTNNSFNNCFGTSAGTVVLNGNAQVIGGTNSTMFNNLILSGIGNKSLAIDQYVGGGYVNPAGVIDLTNRSLLLNSNTLHILNPLPGSILRTTGLIESETAPPAAYGYIKWNIGNIPPGNIFVFPFGITSTSSYLPISFDVTASGAGAGGYVKIATYPTVTTLTPNNRPLPLGVTQLNSVSGAENAPYVTDRYYIFDVNNYTTLPQANLTFSYNDSEWNTGNNTINESNLQMQKIIDGTSIWSYPPFGNVNTSANTVTVNNYNGNYNPVWTIVDINSPLPVELIDFSVSLNSDNHALINWTSANENEIQNFDVEKSDDGINFKNLLWKAPYNNGQSVNNYSEIDYAPFNGITYYRLKVNDINGSWKYSQIESVYKTVNTVVMVYPNPARDMIIIKVLDSNIWDSLKDLEIQMFDVTGRLVLNSSPGSLNNQGFSTFALNIENISSGIYNFRVKSNDTVFSEMYRIVVQK